MDKFYKHNKTKHGAASVFLAIIMSAVIFIECTFVIFVWNLDYALSLNTALKSQVDTILCDYNRLLFDVYGIYAFTLDGVDDYCFRKALEINGLESKAEVYITDSSKFTTEDLRKAINSYYWYRGSGIAFKKLVEGYADLIREIDEKGYLNKIGQFMQSPAAEYVSKLIKGSDSASDWIEKAGDLLNAGDLIKEAADIDSLMDDYKDSVKDLEFDIDIDIAEWNGLLSTLTRLENAFDVVSDSPDALAEKCFISHYCAYNFDCCISPKGDASINGTDFKSIHGSKRADSEYMITGLGDYPASLEVSVLIVHVLIVANILKDYANEEIRNTISVIAEVISAIILAVSEGTVDIDPRLIAAGITLYVAMVQSINDYLCIARGERAVIFEYDNTRIVTYSYRDFLYLFCLCTKEDKLIERCYEVIERDFGDLYKGISLEAVYKSQTYSVTKSYQLYE